MNIDFALITPEIYLLLVIAVLFVQSLLGGNASRSITWLPYAAGVGIVVTFLAMNGRGVMFFDAYQLDGLSQFFKLAVSAGLFIAVLNAQRQPTLEEDKRSDYYLFMCLSAFGLMLLSSAAELITIYLALELASYSLYALVPLRAKDRRAAEAGIKYILFGAVATAIALYGFSYILAAQQTTYLSDLALLSWSWADSPMAVAGLTMFLAGMFYKLALFPFHFWCPDVYEGASNETATYIATLPKLGAVVILIRLVAMLDPGHEIITILAILSALSMTYGNLSALAQKDLKRVLGYSSVAHAGYVIVGLVAGTPKGLAAAAFYSLVYVLMNLTCFWVICRVAVNGRNLEYKDLNGLHRRSPALAFILAVSVFSLVGLPPTAGFIGKLFLLTSAWNHGYNWLVIVASVNTAISIYYYLSFARHAYTQDAEAEEPLPVKRASLVWGGVLAACVLLLGILPMSVFEWAYAAGRGLMP